MTSWFVIGTFSSGHIYIITKRIERGGAISISLFNTTYVSNNNALNLLNQSKVQHAIAVARVVYSNGLGKALSKCFRWAFSTTIQYLLTTGKGKKYRNLRPIFPSVFPSFYPFLRDLSFQLHRVRRVLFPPCRLNFSIFFASNSWYRKVRVSTVIKETAKC